jgi:hypothetical protein
MSAQMIHETGRVYDEDKLIGEVTCELVAGDQTTGLLTFDDILLRDRVVDLLEDKPLLLETSNGQRQSFVLSGTVDGSNPSLPVRFT